MTSGEAGWPVVGMVGAGQLARMTQQAAIALGVDLRVLAGAAGESAARVVGSVRLGDYRDLATLREFARGCDVITFDHEHVPSEHVEALAAEVAVRPGAEALVHAQDKAVMRERLSAIGAPCPAWARVATAQDVEAFAEEHGRPFVLKAARGGYDGRGVWVVGSASEAAGVLASGTPLIAEELVPFERELAVVVARSPHGQGVSYPVVETVQRDGICVEVIAPATGMDPEHAAQAQHIALKIANELGVTGVLAVEMFQLPGGRVVVNELAMRPHNSGHWTIEGARTSQFEQHLRAVLDLPLGSPSPVAPVTVMANVLGGEDPDMYRRYEHVMAHDPGVKIHFYGKDVRPGRKIGHVTALGTDVDEVRARARHAAVHLATGEYV
ncbi:5-(carboxyamino)imidazole ribonucleotide synthase [Sphaerisporangium sp. B11E5]|uniref:5-(carboxyamino)imidazole ribonucleotide synthase n=1 Tax=Sphaerisporangium sp. B11E5 TaxID=3153563 RepID=UPI00325D78D6